jgi:hypothetical protein
MGGIHMAEQRKKEEVFTSPKGVLKFGSISKPSDRYKPEGEYQVRMLLDPNDAATIELVEKLTKDHAAGLAAAKKAEPKKKFNDMGTDNMFKPDTDKDGAETGKGLLFTFKAKASGVKKDKTPWQFKPAVFDSKGKPLAPDVLIYSGSVVKVAYSIRHTAMPTGAFYTSLSLKAVQVITLGQGGRDASSYGFTDEDGFESDDDTTGVADGEQGAPAGGEDF